MKFTDDDPAVMARLLIFLYTADFSRANPKDRENVIYKGQLPDLIDPLTECDHIDELRLCIKMYCLADKYIAPDLKELVLRYYCDTLYKYAEHLENSQNHVSGTIFGSKLISLVYDANTIEKDRNLKILSSSSSFSISRRPSTSTDTSTARWSRVYHLSSCLTYL
jgi:hypothetical protein